MVTSIYLAGTAARSGKSAVAVGLLHALARRAGRVGVFRPVAPSSGDILIETLLSLLPGDQSPAEVSGVTYEDLHDDPERAMSTIVDRFHHVTAGLDTVLVVGTDFTDVPAPEELSVNARVAANLGSGMVLVVPALSRRPDEVSIAAVLAVDAARASHAHVLGVVANQVPSDLVETTATALGAALGSTSTAVLPEAPLLRAPSVRDLLEACDGHLVHGDEELLDRECMGLVIAAMTMPHVLDRLIEGGVVVVPGDRDDVVLGVLLAHRSATFPSLSGLVVNGNLPLSPQIERLIAGLDVRLPIVSAPEGTMATAYRLGSATGRITAGAGRKIRTAVALVEEHLDPTRFLDGLRLPPGAEDVVTPIMFEHGIVESARRAKAHIVLPEGTEPRILRAAAVVVDRGIARVTLLGDVDEVRAEAAGVGLDLASVSVVDPLSSPWREGFAAEYARLRAHRGVTVEQAYDTVADPAYFGPLMVRAREADGMVSGSVTTTAHTVRPALEIIRTAPGVSVVSSVFFMCLADRVLVYGDCAINPDPDAAQLADVAISSARTARQFGIEPRVAMLSYSTGVSGTGPHVDKVRTATAMVRDRAPELPVEGPIQYDAAIDPAVASTKLRDSAVAGRATVLVFPDLNTGNITYKAVQRSAAAVAVGPVLQGLNRPVNDLSRGATVRDIVNTVAITAIQAHTP